MKILNPPASLWILLWSIGSLSLSELCLSSHLAHAQTIADVPHQSIAQSNNVTPPIRGRSKGDLPLGTTKINTTATAKDPIKKIVGTWVNNNLQTQGITKLIIAKAGNRHSVQLFQKCNPTDCNLGKRLLHSSFWENSGSTHIEATYKQANVVRNIEIQSPQFYSPSSPTEINVLFSNQFTNKSRKPNYSSNETFRKI